MLRIHKEGSCGRNDLEIYLRDHSLGKYTAVFVSVSVDLRNRSCAIFIDAVFSIVALSFDPRPSPLCDLLVSFTRDKPDKSS
jgi:hypothetical protein